MGEPMQAKKGRKFYVKCQHCHGKGEVPLPQEYEEVLKSLCGPSIDTLTLAKKHRIAPNAMCNRLTRLLKLGLVWRHRVGKLYFWSRL